MKIEHSRRARPGYELNCDAKPNPIFYFRGGEKIQLTAPCWPRVPTAGVQCPGLCQCWGRGQNFPHYRQNYFPNTLISTCPALILLLKSDKSSQMLHCTVRPVSKIDLLVESILRTAELCLGLLTKQTTNSPLSTHSEIGPMTIMLSKSPLFNSWIWKYTLCRLAAGCQNQSNLSLSWRYDEPHETVTTVCPMVAVSPRLKSHFEQFLIYPTCDLLPGACFTSFSLTMTTDNIGIVNIDFKIGNGKQKEFLILTSIYS